MQKYAATPYAAHHQFYLRDPELAWDGGYTNHPWSDDGLGVAPGVVGVQTPRAAGSTAVFVELHERAPGDPPPRYQKIAAASIATGGKLVLAGEANELDTPSLSISLPTGTYGVRVCYADLDTVTYDSDDGAEHYVVQIYPRSAEPPVVQRAYESGGRPPDRKDRSAEPVEALIAAAGGDDASVACSALVALARKGETTTVASIAASERSTDAVRIVAVYALRLVRAREAIASLSVGGSAVVAHVVARALQGLEEDAADDDAADDDATGDDAADDDAADDDASATTRPTTTRPTTTRLRLRTGPSGMRRGCSTSTCETHSVAPRGPCSAPSTRPRGPAQASARSPFSRWSPHMMLEPACAQASPARAPLSRAHRMTMRRP